jgi:hypothetical protein
MIDLNTIEQLRTKWTRQQSKMANMLQEMEKELESVKKRNIHESIIKTKEQRINEIIGAINSADDLIQILIVEIKKEKLSNAIIEMQLTRWLHREGKLSEFASQDNTLELVHEVVKEFNKKRP